MDEFQISNLPQVEDKLVDEKRQAAVGRLFAEEGNKICKATPGWSTTAIEQ